MPDYGRKTVAELQEILKGRSLPHSGKKAELVARLNEADKLDATTTSTTAPEAAPEAAPAPSQTDAEPVANTAKPEAAPVPEPASQEPSAPTDTNDATPPIPAAKTERTDRGVSANTDSNLAAAADYSIGLDQSSYDDELKKRRARAERFGAPAEDLDAEALRVAERAKRFGTGATTMVGKLDEALPINESARRAKRGRDGAGSLEDPGLRQGTGSSRTGSSKRRNPPGRGDGRRGERPTGVQKGAGRTASSVFSSEKDRLAAEARMKKFATA